MSAPRKPNSNACWALAFESQITKAREGSLSSTAILRTSTACWSCCTATEPNHESHESEEYKVGNGHPAIAQSVWVGHLSVGICTAPVGRTFLSNKLKIGRQRSECTSSLIVSSTVTD